MSAKTRLILILAATVTLYPLLTWFLISFNSRRGHNGYLTFSIISILFVVPIYPLLRSLRKRPPLSALAILLVIASGTCGFAGLTGIMVLHLDTGWVNVAANLCEGLMIASCVLLIWNAFVQRKRNRQ
jgi:hypothetical protein